MTSVLGKRILGCMDNHTGENVPSQPSVLPKSRENLRQDVTLNGYDALELHVKKRKNLTDPIMDVEVKINNPVNRLWEAIKKIWKSQKTIIGIKFTIPLLVLPIVMFIGYRLWLGRGVSVPMAKVGIIHEITINGKEAQALILPSSDVYLLEYPPTTKIIPDPEKPIVVFGMYNHLTNVLRVERVSFYNSVDEKPSSYTTVAGTVGGATILQSIVTGIWSPIASFLGLF